MLSYRHLTKYPVVFKAMTGLRITELDAIADSLLPLHVQAEAQRLARPDRKRAMGGGHPFELAVLEQVLLTVIWLRLYPTQEVLGFLFGVSDSTARRVILKWLPLLEKTGRAGMRMPDPGKRQRRHFEQLLQDLPELMVVIDTFEQRVQRPQDRREADRYYSGKKKQHTLKSQVAIHEDTGEIVAVAASVYGPTADIKVLEGSHLLPSLPEGVGAMGDLAYLGLERLHPHGLGASPRRKPRGQPRPAADVAFNTAFSRRRIRVEHTIGRMRRYEALSHADRHHRLYHTARVAAIAGLVNYQIRMRHLN
jgi:DDE superfamily endonuclease/Helix-turn-helix of DDE superfamily endonuclease